MTLHNGCHTKNLERDTKYNYEKCRETGICGKEFHGVKITDLDEIEKLFEVNIHIQFRNNTDTRIE